MARGELMWPPPPPSRVLTTPPFPLCLGQERVSSKCLPVIADRGIIIDDVAIVVEYIEARRVKGRNG